MKYVLNSGKKPIKMWAEDLTGEGLQQAINLSHLPFLHKHVAIMPDAHMGYGMPIGGVIACKDVVIPHAVGFDIACGVLACKTPLTDINQEQIKMIFGGSKKYKGGIRSLIPVGIKKNKRNSADIVLLPSLTHLRTDHICMKELSNSLKQLGTLGGGNHFIEIQKGDDGHIWIMIHSGSRHMGYSVAHHYNKVAIELNKKWHSNVPKEFQLAFLPVDSEEGQDYIKEMKYCMAYAKASRMNMLEKCIYVFCEMLHYEFTDWNDLIWDVAHNYASLEHHYGENVWVHRKGATMARQGQLGIIPGSQGSSSFIVRGKGNLESFMSCSHGAGRIFSSTKAKKELSLGNEQAMMDEKGIVHSLRNISNLDEAPSAYKNIHDVMDNQKDLIDIEVELTPLGVIKG